MDLTAFIFFLVILQGICLYIGSSSAKGLNAQNSHEEYFLAGKNIRFFPLMMTFLATQVGGGVILGAAEEAYHFGWQVLFYPLGAALGLTVLGLGVGRALAKFKVSTIAQIFEVAYGSSSLKKFASVLSIVSLFLIFVAQIIASNKFLSGLGLDNQFWFIVFWAVVIIYTAVGGLKAVVATDVVQASFFIGAFLFCFAYVMFFSEVPFSSILENNKGIPFESEKLYGWLFMPFFFMLIEQDMGQRCFAAKSPQTVSKATLCAGACLIVVCVIPVFFGVFAKHLALEIPAGASVLMTVIQKTSSPIVTALVACAILAAIISTADSLINAISSNLALDFGLIFQKVRISQAMTASIAVLGVLSSFFFDNIVDLLIQSYELSVSCIFVPILFALFKKRAHFLSATFAICFGAVGFLLFRAVPIAIPKELATVLLSLVGYGIGEMFAMIRVNRHLV